LCWKNHESKQTIKEIKEVSLKECVHEVSGVKPWDRIEDAAEENEVKDAEPDDAHASKIVDSREEFLVVLIFNKLLNVLHWEI